MEIRQKSKGLKQPLSLLALVAANLVPLVGVLFFGWDHTLVIALFWIENLIIGAFNVLRMVAVLAVTKSGSRFFHPLFFIFHYGMFCTVHGVFLWDILNLGDKPEVTTLFGFSVSGIFELIAEGVAVFQGFVALHSPIIWLGVISLLLSRLVSFIENFIIRGEIFKIKVKTLMGRPYAQIVVMHAGIIFGAAAIERFGSSVALLLIIVAFKLIVDCVTHQRQYKPQSETSSN